MCRFKSCHPHQILIIRTTPNRLFLLAMGSDLSYILTIQTSIIRYDKKGTTSQFKSTRSAFRYLLILFACSIFHSSNSRFLSSLSKNFCISGSRHLANASISCRGIPVPYSFLLIIIAPVNLFYCVVKFNNHLFHLAL